MTASGSVSDYADTTSLRSSIATVAGVDASAVSVTVAAASVLITATIAVPASTTPAAMQTTLSSSLGTAAAASTTLGVTVLSVPTVALAASPPPPPLDASADALAAATSTVTIGSGAYWSAIPSSPSSYTVTVGDKLSFRYNSNHNLYLMASKAAYDSCNFDGATELGSSSVGGGTGETPNLYEAVVTTAGTLYLACQVSAGSHCAGGQKVAITAAAIAAAAPPGSDSVSGSNSGSDSVDLALVVGLVLGGVALFALAVATALVCRGGRATRARARATAPGAAAAAPKAAVGVADFEPVIALTPGAKSVAA